MPLGTQQRRAAAVIVILGIGLAITLAPFVTGLVGAPVLYVIFSPFYRLLTRRLKPSIAAVLVAFLGLLLIVVPVVWLVVMMANETPAMIAEVLKSPLLERLGRLEIGRFKVGQELEQAGAHILQWAGSNALVVLGGVTRTALNLTFAFFGLYFLLKSPGEAWDTFRPYVPFSEANTNQIHERFKAVTISTLIGTGLAAVAQGVLMWLGFLIVGIPNAWFWGVVTMAFSVLPVVGSGIVLLPGVIALLMDGRYVAGSLLAAWGLLIVSNVDNIIRPLVYRKYAQVHPLVTLVGAIAGVSYFGLLGLLLGPLALSYFFELMKMYRDEYEAPAEAAEAAAGRRGSPSSAMSDPPAPVRPLPPRQGTR